MTTVFIVTSGEDADYKIRGVFSTKELAQQFIEIFGEPKIPTVYKMRVEEYVIDAAENQLRAGLKPYYIEMERDGRVIHLGINPLWQIGKCESFTLVERDRFVRSWFLRLYTLATDRDDLIRIANEKREQLIAQNIWQEPQQTEIL